LHLVTAYYLRAFIIVDALDECSVYEGGRQKFLTAIFDLQAKTGANIFATSQINNDIAKLFKGAPSFQIYATNEDVERYLDGQMLLHQSDILDDELQGTIKREVIKAFKGMYVQPSTNILYVSNLILVLGSSLRSYT